MSTLLLRHGANQSGNPAIAYGDKNTDVQISFNEPVFHTDQVSVAGTHGTATLWITGGGGIGAWVWGVLLSDQDIYIERKNDKVTPEYALNFIPANTPFYFGYKVGGGTTQRLTGSALASGTAFGATTQIKVQNEGSTAANVRMWLFS